jgi:hypothetical protein
MANDDIVLYYYIRKCNMLFGITKYLVFIPN